MSYYRKKPVIIEARRYLSDADFPMLQRFTENLVTGCTYKPDTLLIPTLEGDMEVARGDFIIKGVKGEFYPCKPDIFFMTYELVEE